MLKQPTSPLIQNHEEQQARGSGLGRRGGNPEVESPPCSVQTPPYATCAFGLEGRCGILPGARRGQHLPLLNLDSKYMFARQNRLEAEARDTEVGVMLLPGLGAKEGRELGPG